MLKNVVISMLAAGHVFTNTPLNQYGMLVYIAITMVVFGIVCSVEWHVEEHKRKARGLEKFQRTVNRKITLNQPTKAS